MQPLLNPLKVGALELKNRIILAPLTRCRASGADGRTPNELMLEYYVQRVTAGLIFTEATAISPMGVGYPNTPGIWSEDHVRGWKKITEAIHREDGKIILQLWHVGRVSHPLYLDGKLPIAPSAIAPPGHVNLVKPVTAFVTPRALETAEISQIVLEYRNAAENAKKAGFDGVELHGANGYLLDQFLQDNSNRRSDQYGGSVENRARLMLEVTDAVTEVWGPDRVGVHLSPRKTAAMADSNPQVTFAYVVKELSSRRIAFLCIREYEDADSLGPSLRKMFKGVYIGNEKFSYESAEAAIARGDMDAVAFGKDFLANPDLVKRFELKCPLNKPIPETFYSAGSVGYTDYPFLKKEANSL